MRRLKVSFPDSTSLPHVGTDSGRGSDVSSHDVGCNVGSVLTVFLSGIVWLESRFPMSANEYYLVEFGFRRRSHRFRLQVISGFFQTARQEPYLLRFWVNMFQT